MSQSTSERDRDRRGFKELAKLAGSPARPKTASVSGIRRSTDPDENDSGMVDLHALAAADPGAVDRASVTPLASATLFEEEPITNARIQAPRLSPPPIPPSVRPPSSTPLVSPSIPRPIVASAQAVLVAPAPKRRSVLGPITAVVGFAAIAAGAFFVVRTARAPGAGAPESVVAAAQPAGETAHGAIAQAPAPTPAANPGVDPLSLPKETAATPGHHATHAWHGHGTQTLVAKADPKEADEAPAPKSEAKAEPPAAKEAPAPPPPPPPNNALFNSMKLAAANTPAATAPAATPEATPVPAAATVSSSSGVAQRPSQGQVTGALGGVIPEARNCLNDEDGVSRAHVVFGSDGAVQAVQISGFAAGKPVEACIKAALGKAHVPPFAEASYGATVTVRP